MSTSLVLPKVQNLPLKRTDRHLYKWRERGTYGKKLLQKLEYLMDLFDEEAVKKGESFSLENIINLSRTIDFNISIQLSNIRAVEEKKALKDLEKWKNELISKLTNQGSLQTVSATYKY